MEKQKTIATSQISINVSAEIIDYKEKNELNWREIINLGIKMHQNMPNISKRMQELENSMEKLQKANRLLQGKVLELDDEVTSLRQNQLKHLESKS